MNISFDTIKIYATTCATKTQTIAQNLYNNIREFPTQLPAAYGKMKQDEVIRKVAATVLGVMGLAAFASSLPVVGSLALFLPAMAPAFSGGFPLIYATAAVALSYKLFQ